MKESKSMSLSEQQEETTPPPSGATKIFVACPIGADDSAERIRSDKLLKYVIYPVIKQIVGAEPDDIIVRSDKIGEPGRITTQILRELIESDVVIADLTGNNPNVMYEVGVRQALIKPLVLMAEKGQKLPFDLADLRTIFYQLDLEHVETAQGELGGHLKNALIGKVASLDRALFTSARNEPPTGDQPSNARDLLPVLEVCQSILQETQEVAELIKAVGGIVLQIQGSKEEQEKIQKEAVSQQMGMMLISQLFQNPDSAEKLMPLFQKFIDANEASTSGNKKKRK